MLNDFIFKEQKDIPSKEIHYSPKDRGVESTIKNLSENYNRVNRRCYNQQRIIDSLKEQIETQNRVLDSKIKTIQFMDLEIHDLKVKYSKEINKPVSIKG